jgi:ADP-heptose:LPS heptosyltransferase
VFKKIWRKFSPNPLERILKRAQKSQKTTFLIAWNRGLGDVALGLYALIFRIRELIPQAEITILTREDLKEGFSLLVNVTVLVASSWKRGASYDVKKTLEHMGKNPSSYDVILKQPDPTYWVKWQLGTLTPKLRWEAQLDELWRSFPLHDQCTYVGLQPQTETLYGYEKNWPISYWQELIKRLTEKSGTKVILFGKSSTSDFSFEHVIDLRGKTTLLEMLSIIKNRCQTLILPDSGVLSLTYFIDAEFPLKIVSLWSDPRQGVLKQNVPSPNMGLKHVPLVAEKEDLKNISVAEVCAHV